MIRNTERSGPRWLSGVLALAVVFGVLWWERSGEDSPSTMESGVEAAFDQQRSGEMFEVGGRVARRLADDREGDRHQRFVVELPSGLTLLVAHNIDIAPRVPLEVGDTVTVRGQYEWNERGGVLHWTHHDPRGRRRDTGWVRHQGRTYG